jgi:hypothetical protein
LVPSPISGRPVASSTGENTVNSWASRSKVDTGIDEALAASAAEYAPPALFNACTNSA